MKPRFKFNRRKVIVLSSLILIILLIIAFSGRKGTFPGYHKFFYTPSGYLKQVEKIQKYKTDKYREYRESQNPAIKDRILAEACDDFPGLIIKKLFPYWYGTRWSFEGMSEIPGKGSIACGYFVTTILRDAGYILNRSELAQLPSESMILRIIDEDYIHRFSNKEIKGINEYLKELDGVLFLVGLDTHTGFIYREKNNFYFVHSSGKYPWAVVRENILKSKVFIESKYKVIASLDADQDFVLSWLRN